jgi:hypothetical protein
MRVLKGILGVVLLLGAIAGAILTNGMLLPIMLPLAAFGMMLLGVPMK